MSKTKKAKPSADAMAMMMRIDLMPATAVYDTVKSTPLIMTDAYE